MPKIKLYIKRINVKEPQEREDGTEFVNMAISVRGLEHDCTKLTFIGDTNDIESFIEDLKQIPSRSIEVDSPVKYVDKEYEDADGVKRTVKHANGDFNHIGCAIDDALDALDAPSA